MNRAGTMMQFFEWYLPQGMLWKKLAAEAENLKGVGITAVWIPPCYKGSAGANDVGYGVYDLYDLGEFDQKGTVPTKYGSRDELLAAIDACHKQNIQVYADIVLDHKMGADRSETVPAKEYNPDDRNRQEGSSREIEAWTHFTFPGRGGKYSDFEWHWNDFVAIDWDEKTDKNGIFKFRGKEWQENVDEEKGNFDYLMGADIDLNNPHVQEELIRWGKWFVSTTHVDGFRLDAVKHMEFTFYNQWLDALRKEFNQELFAVGEYWNADVGALKNYIDTTEGALSLFDVPLHFNFMNCAQSMGNFDMRQLFDHTLIGDNPYDCVTFVDNHDTQPETSLQSWVQEWFKPLAYAAILLRQDGYPCVFYGDYYGIEHNGIAPLKEKLDPLLAARIRSAYGKQNDYFDHPNIVGWTREGDDEHPGSGLAVIMTNKDGGEKRMFVGPKFAGREFTDCTGNRSETVRIEDDGNGTFGVNGGSVSVWLPKQ